MVIENLMRVAAAAGLAAVLSFTAVSSSQAARHHRRSDAPSNGLYNYVPNAATPYQYNRGNALSPPDPASCGGFPC